ncbi:Xaa-Pro aminopeptidase [bacterium]|nr:Xaa-Pro aminopeptidase [bacterium]
MALRRVALASANVVTRRLVPWVVLRGRQFSSVSVSVGQPTPATHPHLMQSGELTPGFTSDEYIQRRANLVAMLPPNSVVLLASAAPVHLPNTVIPIPGYRQDADFAYLTGVTQPGVVAMLQVGDQSGSDKKQSTYTLLVPPQSKHNDVWNGPRIDSNTAVSYFNAGEAHEVPNNMTRVLLSALAKSQNVFLDQSILQFDDGIRTALSTAGVLKRPPQALRPLMHRLRWQKSIGEIDAMKASVNASINGFRDAMKHSNDGINESEIGARHEFICKLHGADRLAYPSVVAGGSASLIVHYSAMNKLLGKGELLLMDAGCERNGYVSDITRTWPVCEKSGFSNAQADVYDAVLAAHSQCVAAAHVGVSLHELHLLSVEVLSQGLRDLGVKSDFVTNKSVPYQKYYPHSVGHWLGMDTHDTPSVSTSSAIAKGCAFTIEPGLYFPVDDPAVPKALRGIGVRIEDNLAVDPVTGEMEVLSAALPVGRREVEELVRELRR